MGNIFAKTFHAGLELDLRGIIYQVIKTDLNKVTMTTLEDGDEDYHTKAIERLGLPSQIWLEDHGLYIDAVKIQLVAKPINGEEWDGAPVQIRETAGPTLFDYADGQRSASVSNGQVNDIIERLRGETDE